MRSSIKGITLFSQMIFIILSVIFLGKAEVKGMDGSTYVFPESNEFSVQNFINETDMKL